MPLTHAQWVEKYCPDQPPVLMMNGSPEQIGRLVSGASTPPPADPDAALKAEYAADRTFARMGITEADYIASRRIDANHGQRIVMTAEQPANDSAEPAPYAVGSRFCMPGEYTA